MVSSHVVLEFAYFLNDCLPLRDFGVKAFSFHIGLLGLQRQCVAVIVELIDYCCDDYWPTLDHSLVSDCVAIKPPADQARI